MARICLRNRKWSPGGKVVSETATTTTFTITANEALSVTKNPADTWIKSIYPASGSETAVVTISFTRNAHSSDARSSVLGITGGNSFILPQEGDTEGLQAIAGDDFSTANAVSIDESASTVVYTNEEGDTDIREHEQIPVSIILEGRKSKSQKVESRRSLKIFLHMTL